MTTVTITAGGLLVNGANEVLLGQRAHWKAAWPDHWDAIGGRLEPGERVEQALVRELGEEIGVTALDMHLLAIVETPGPGENDIIESHIFAVTSWAGMPWNACDEHVEIRWFSLADLAALEPQAGRGYVELAAQAVAVRQAIAG